VGAAVIALSFNVSESRQETVEEVTIQE
jgi:hypothetical protein